MCGIVGILGREPVAPSLVGALGGSNTEATVPLASPRWKAGSWPAGVSEGKLRNLEARLAREPLAGSSGIGNTRWATHGRPTESNAHPHATDRLAVVHNGIIENFHELRHELERKGAKFGSDTDTEVIAHLVTEELAGGRSPAEAVEAVLPRLRGAFALVRARARRWRSATATTKCILAPTPSRSHFSPTRSLISKTATGQC